jgi:hypothetical protein
MVGLNLAEKSNTNNATLATHQHLHAKSNFALDKHYGSRTAETEHCYHR